MGTPPPAAATELTRVSKKEKRNVGWHFFLSHRPPGLDSIRQTDPESADRQRFVRLRPLGNRLKIRTSVLQTTQIRPLYQVLLGEKYSGGKVRTVRP